LVLKSEPVKATESDKIRAVLITGIRLEGIQCLPWTEILRSVQQRIQFLRRMFGSESGWPDLSDATLLDSLEDWLAPFLIGMTRISSLKTLNLKQALMTNLSREQIRLLDELAPTHLDVPSGSRIRIDYSGDIPVLAVRVQEMFGCRETPAIASGRQKLLVHLLSPAGRPVQVTQDIAGFWTGSYPDVKKELKGRYPKHDWPDDPIRAVPTNRAKRRGNR
jgi:ATP-dependent helicase HrpB